MDAVVGLLNKCRVKLDRILIINPTEYAKSVFSKTIELPKIRDIYSDFELDKEYRKLLKDYIDENF